MSKMIFNGLEFVAGINVKGNPTGTPTATLTTIQIGDTIYELPSGGGGSSVVGVISGYSERRYITSNFIVGEGTYQS